MVCVQVVSFRDAYEIYKKKIMQSNGQTERINGRRDEWRERMAEERMGKINEKMVGGRERRKEGGMSSEAISTPR